MNTKESHLHLLCWYVSGKIGLRERQDIDAHLRECESCRAEVASLTSLMKSLQSQEQAGHISGIDLVSYEEAPLSLNSVIHVALEDHLAQCPACREDLGILRQARRNETAPMPLRDAPTGRRVARRGWAWAAAGAAAFVLLVAWPLRFEPPLQSPPPKVENRVMFPAPRRGTEPSLTLEGTGPWSIRVLLPFDAKQGPYNVQVYSKDHGPAQLDITAPADSEQSVEVFLPKLSGPGRYEMRLTRTPPSTTDSYLYSFELLAQTLPKPTN